MKRFTGPISRTGATAVLLLGVLGRASCPGAAPLTTHSEAAALDYEKPPMLVGNIFVMAPDPKKLLFQFRRSATRTGTVIRVLREYTYPDGSLAARSRIVYDAGRLAACETEEFQTGERGSAAVRPDPKSPDKTKVEFNYERGHGSNARTNHNSESLEGEPLVDDMIPAFMVNHWDTLMRGSSAKFRFIALSRTETVGFKLVKESETLWRGNAVVRIRMEPTSFVIAHLINPLLFIVEKDPPHRIFEYIGRTTPLVKNGNKWKELDAVSVFEYK